MQSKWDICKTVLLLAEDPAQGSLWELPEFIITGNVEPDHELAPASQRTVSFTEIKLPSSSQSTAPVFRADLVKYFYSSSFTHPH